ncbi:enoyl-CoA hydratase domain-containing protein 3, mitochondrial [Homalodisca vitripennis]|nr:enoyl-CoA hydratase domain-containing protein 3, mitochondrial [Homalodisca vitripennis]XP_046673481.1 enoyl-CoA hydratase domain-containing protein 3, mitochondrial [Homalodisca vitripennis]XP_046673482.1 enoyl-CoA hydratase domain-containing protein 3, mitochondrial [Homalodisca vitripennis]XP_046673483.1 enoyl-CoA hydratase domain-containing protein 3, mitochondrial [Homalodisca vitripennis]XP_046673484.1 enoyl-CoA hydratase domain-containing protein 3, mitochondrial [Homalodisca vitripen
MLRCWRTVLPALSYSTATSGPTTRMVQEKGVRTITLCDVKTRNSLSLSTINAIIHQMTTNNEDTGLRCIVLRAEGPVFSSGHNLKEFDGSKKGTEEQREVFAACTRLMLQVVEAPVPVVAVVNGLAAAAGCQLVAQCDIALCTPNSTFSTPGASFGLFCSTPGIAVARTVNRKMALRMLLTGLPITAEEAHLAGLVSKVVPAESLDSELKIITDAIESKSRAVISLGKKFFYQQIERDLHTAYQLGEETMVKNLLLRDGQEGIKSFIEKRKPTWEHGSNNKS